ncbi:MAG: acylneuraminate cytidylyltransferase family protein [Planctomycetes bacterium]|nr:acylneuraminate cytidylyltransferase family protein [Planctomycetota bacterium]
MANIVAVIPARSGSKGVPDKNIKFLAGYPLIAYSIAAARLAKNVDRVIVSTDSELYANIARKYGAEVPFLRPDAISGDDSTDYDFIEHVLNWMQDNEGLQPEYLLHLRPTTPLRDPACIEKAIERICHDNYATALRSVHEMSETSYKTVEIDRDYLKCICSGSFDLDAANQPRQVFPKTYIANGYVDIYKSFYVVKNKKILGNKVIAYVTPRIFEVDTLEDFDYLEYQVAKEPAITNKLFGKEKNQL